MTNYTISNDVLELGLGDNKLTVANLLNDKSLELAWPGLAVGVSGKKIIPEQVLTKPEVGKNTLTQCFAAENMQFAVTVTLSDGCWFRKNVAVKKMSELPVVDYLDVDIQQLDDSLKLCGYCPSAQTMSLEPQAEEEGSGGIPGCGYPLIGRNCFVGLAHPAGFNVTDDNGQAYYLRHYPQWRGDTLEDIDAVFGWSAAPRKSFFDYLDTVRLPALDKPLISFCTFWSDPYLGDYEYAVHYDNYLSFFKAFIELGLKPDVFTLDAGWNDRQSIFDAKNDVGGNAGLQKLRDFIHQNGSELSLWVSHNGPVGIDVKYLRAQGFAVGEGKAAAAYKSGEYGVMLDKRFEQALTDSFQRLAGETGAVHFKIDWDNECATNPDFNAQYPTVNHVRQASINAMIRIAAKIRAVNPNIVTRNGWWVSPWWLCHASHIWLCQSGDSEFSALPSKTQRDSASTHRDVMYYNVLQRDKTALPLDCFDNHEFPDALRNPFCVDPVSWVNAIWLSFMRGSTYLAYTLQPEKLEDWQVESFRQIIEFCRKYSVNIFVNQGRMVGGHPGRGDVYGFLQPGERQSWLVLRNPLPIPQEFELDIRSLELTHEVASRLQFYPFYELLEPGRKLTFTAHEVKIIILDREKIDAPYDVPFVTRAVRDGFENYFPTNLHMTGDISPLVDTIYQIPAMQATEIEIKTTAESMIIYFKATAPYRVRNLELQVKVSGPGADNSTLQVNFSRYPKAESSAFSLPVTEITRSLPGYGEVRNVEGIAAKRQKYYAVSIPDGGEAFFRAEFRGIDPQRDELEMWLAGYEAPSRKCLKTELPPFGFDKAVPYQHPLGFPRAVRIS